MFRTFSVRVSRTCWFESMPFYAVRVGRETGIFNTWSECKKRVDGVPARFKKFSTIEEAESFMNKHDPRDYVRKPFIANSAETGNPGQQKGQYKKTSKRKLETEDVESKRQKTGESWRPVVYSDGCCTRNGKSHARAGIGVFWGDGDSRNVSESLTGHPTNQRAELNAAIRALETACEKNLREVELRTDSMYTLNAMTNWINSWKQNGFRTVNGGDVKNKEDIVKLHNLCQKIDVKWTHVRGHSNVYGNEKADELARQGSIKPRT